MSSRATGTRWSKRAIGLVAGPLAALLILAFLDLDPGSPAVTRTAAVAVLMAVWWMTEAIPIPATALLPVALFPLLGVMAGNAVAAVYFNNVIFLFVGGFLIALTMERWGLHRRIAIGIILLIGTGPPRIILGFMTATAFLSMWISNTATAMMMVPMALAIVGKIAERADEKAVMRFGAGLLIGIAYAASIGGTATLIGTPPNLAFSRIFAIEYPGAPEITFAGWFVFGLPFAVVFLLIAWRLLVFLFARGVSFENARPALFRAERRNLGPASFEEKVILTAFLLVALLWIFRADIGAGGFTIPGWSRLLPAPSHVDDGTVAIAIALLLFLVPSRTRPGERLLDWSTAKDLNWGIVLLFGGGFALASAFEESGLSVWIARQLTILHGVPPLLVVVAVCLMLTFLTELTSNTATINLFLPLLASLSTAAGTDPLLLMVPATLSASCAFMLPVGTPPNAIVFGSGRVSMGDMMRAGIFMNLIGVVLITAVMYLLGLRLFGIDPSVMPAWAAGP